MFHRPLIPILLSFIAGILSGHIGFLHGPSPLLFLTLLTISILIALLFIPVRFRYTCLLVLFFLAGILLNLSKLHDSDLLPLANQRERVVIEGTVLEPARTGPQTARLVVRSDKSLIHGTVKTGREKILVTIYNHTRDFLPGDKIRFPARLRPFKNFNNPGRYNHEFAMRVKGLSCAASVSDGRLIVPMGEGHLDFPMETIEKVKRPIRMFFQEKLSSQNRALFLALILGERQGISPELREFFNVAGLGHILAVSGLHIGLVAWLAFILFKRLFSLSYSLLHQIDIRKLAAIMTCFAVVAYTCLAGLQVSSQRAMIMVLAYLFSMILGRERDVWSTLSLAAFMVLAVDPNALFSVSFQLSFCAVIGILWLSPAIYTKILSPMKNSSDKTIIAHLYVYFAGLLVVTLSAVIFLLPITSFYFHRISLVSIPANLTVVPILGLWIIPFGLLSIMILPISLSMASLFLQIGAWGSEWMMAIIQFWAHFQWAACWVVTPNIFEIILFYGLIFFLFFLRRWAWAKMGLLLVLLLFATDISYWIYKTRFNRHLKVTYLDIGQGNSALIQFPGKERMLIDGGGFPRDNFDVGRSVVAPFLFHSKILHIDYLVLTHPQADHMNGLRFIASNFHPKEFWTNGDIAKNQSFQKLMNILETEKIKRLLPADLREGREISGVKIDILHPPSDGGGGKVLGRTLGLNNNSLVLKLSYGGKSFLFPGDLERAGEEMIVFNAGTLLKSDILLAPHHGSKSSCSKPFLEMVRPNICIISSGSGNRFRFPHSETLHRLKQTGCRIIRTDRVGAVQLYVSPNRLEINSFLD